MKQTFKPARGRIALITESVAEVVKWIDGPNGVKIPIYRTEESQDHAKSINPWAMVVGVGEPRVADDGKLVTTDCEPGDRVAYGQVGRHLPLVDTQGNVEFVYCVPFEGILGHLVRVCDACGFESKADIDNLTCPNCPTVVRPSINEVWK